MNDPQCLADRYVAVWNETDPDRRRRAIAEVETGRPALCRYARSVRIRRARKEDHRLAREERPRRWPPLSRWTECPRVARCGRLSVGNGARRRRAGSSGRARIPDARPRSEERRVGKECRYGWSRWH